MGAADFARYVAAAMAGAAASALLMRRRRRLQEADCADPLARPFDCEVCRTRWRSRPLDIDAHMEEHRASKEHRRNLALLKGGSSDGGSGVLSKAADNLHCAYCNVWLRDAAAYSKHAAGKKHAGKVSIAGGTACYPFFDQQACVLHTHVHRMLRWMGTACARTQAASLEAARVEVAPSLRGNLGVITCDLEKAENAGSLCRLLSNFAAEGSSLVHVHTPRVGATAAEAEATQARLLRSQAMALAGRHAHRKLERSGVRPAGGCGFRVGWVSQFREGLGVEGQAGPEPLVSIEADPVASR